MASSIGIIHSDEPTVKDKLNRDKYAEAFAKIGRKLRHTVSRRPLRDLGIGGPLS